MMDVHAEPPPIVAITGPTAVGKSALALELASRFGGEIVSADSRQIYRHLDIGTAKPTVLEQAAIRHHLIDVVEPDEPYSAATFRAQAEAALLDIKRRGAFAVLVGGSPHYIEAVLDRLEIPPVPPQPELRTRLERVAHEQGPLALHDRLRDLDPQAAAEIEARNVRRVVRALEVISVTGERFSIVGRRRGPPVPALRLALTTGREELYRRIDDRVRSQIEKGLLEETRWVLDQGFASSLPPLAGLVYREAIAVLNGNMTLEQGAQRMMETTHAFARRQYTWLRRDKRLRWLEMDSDTSRTAWRLAEDYLNGSREPGFA